jgi:hypothetical protein
VTLRCLLDGLLLPAQLRPGWPALVAWDGDELFAVEAVEAQFYELVAGTPEELLGLQRARYRLLRLAADFRQEAGCQPSDYTAT